MCGEVECVLCVVWWSVFYVLCGGVCTMCGEVECIIRVVWWSVYYAWCGGVTVGCCR